MAITVFNTLTDQKKSDAVETLIRESTPRQDFFFLIILSVLMATLGLLTGSVAVVIGSMLIAPILYPILSFSLGIVMSDLKLCGRALGTIAKSVALAGAAGAAVALFFGNGYSPDDTIIGQIRPSLAYAVIAVIAGFAASFTMAKPQLNEAFPGVAISVALIPPLAVFGIAVARLDWDAAASALLLFGTNAAGVIFASLIVFSLMRFYGKRRVAKQAVTAEKKKVAQETKRAKEEQAR